jgi:hypothetical protein
MELLSGVETVPAVNSSIGQELVAGVDKVKLFMEDIQEIYPSQDLTNICRELCCFFPCCAYLSAIGSFFSEGSIEVNFMRRPDLLSEFIFYNLETIRCVTLMEMVASGKYVKLRIHNDDPLNHDIRIALIEDNPLAIAYIDDDYLLLKHGDDFMPRTEKG